MIFKRNRIDKISFAAAITGLISCGFLDFMIYRPNRLAAGEGILLYETDWVMPVNVLIFCWVGLLLYSLFSTKRFPLFSFLTATVIMGLTLLIAGEYAASTGQAGNPFARISLGAGIWIVLFVVSVLMMDCYQKLTFGLQGRVAIFSIPVILLLWFLMTGKLNQLSLLQEYFNRSDRFYSECFAHLQLAFGASGLSAVVGVPFGIYLTRKPLVARQSFFLLNIVQTIPSIALFALLIAPLAYLSSKVDLLQHIGFQGIGWAPALIALFLYSLLPVVRNTYTGIMTIDASVVESAFGMGMTRSQVMLKVKLPLASGIILNGYRVASVQSIGNTAVAALIGAGGLGIFIFQGLGQAATDLVLLGAIPTIVIAVVADLMFEGIIAFIEPRRKL